MCEVLSISIILVLVGWAVFEHTERRMYGLRPGKVWNNLTREWENV